MVAAAKVYVLEGKLTAEEVEKIKAYCINPIEAREAEQAKPETLISTCEEPEKVKSVTGFLTMSKEEAEALRQSMGLAMSLDDLLWCQKYFNEEHREPTITEILYARNFEYSHDELIDTILISVYFAVERLIRRIDFRCGLVAARKRSRIKAHKVFI